MANKNQREKSVTRLRHTLFLYLAAALFTLVVLITGISCYILLGHLKRAEDNDLLHNVETRSMAVAEWCRHARDLARQVTSRSAIREKLAQFSSGEITRQQLEEFTTPKLADAMKISSEITGIVRLSNDGESVSVCGAADLLANPARFISKNEKEMINLSNPLLIGDKLVVIASAPILNKSNQYIGADLVMLNTDYLPPLICHDVNTGTYCEAFIGYLADGTVHPFFAEHKKHELPSGVATDFGSFRKYIKLAIDGKSGIAHTDKNIIAYSPISDNAWGLAMTKNQHELYSPVYNQLLVIVGISIIAYVAILLGFWKFMRPLAGKILLRVDELEGEVAKQTIQLKSEITEHEIAEQEKEKVIAELQEAIKKVQTLQGLLPICSYCKKIRDDQGYWNFLENYIREHSLAEFSHSICPDCLKQHFPEVYKESQHTKGCHQPPGNNSTQL